MKTKLLGLAVVTALSCGAANAVSLATTLLANTTNNVGLITTLQTGSLTTVTGTAFIYATSVELSALDVAGIDSRAGFEALILSDPGAIRSNIAFTNGAVTSPGAAELGAVGNKTYVWMSSNDNLSYGLFQGPNVPSLGAVTLNSATMTEDLIGTSTFSGIAGTTSGPDTASGFQLAFVPEPSAALLGAFGALGLLRRRRV
ncbi:MAG: hypothetical protein H7A49_06580 [Akkermansiaceae bacterium]|nr:hypothetical protein [Akkermansiaceae bacterium]